MPIVPLTSDESVLPAFEKYRQVIDQRGDVFAPFSLSCSSRFLIPELDLFLLQRRQLEAIVRAADRCFNTHDAFIIVIPDWTNLKWSKDHEVWLASGEWYEEYLRPGADLRFQYTLHALLGTKVSWGVLTTDMDFALGCGCETFSESIYEWLSTDGNSTVTEILERQEERFGSRPWFMDKLVRHLTASN